MKKTNEVSKMVGVSRRALQYYDDEGILAVKRSENNYRLYDQESLEKIWEIMIYKEMGFKLKEIKQLLLLTNSKQKEYLRLRIGDTERQISKLKVQKKFALLILTQGLPKIPEENAGMTYVERIAELRSNYIKL